MGKPGFLRRRSLSPAMACTATRRKPRTSPFSLTTATLWIRGTGYSRLLRYTNALVTGGEKHSQHQEPCAKPNCGVCSAPGTVRSQTLHLLDLQEVLDPSCPHRALPKPSAATKRSQSELTGTQGLHERVTDTGRTLFKRMAVWKVTGDALQL